MDLGQSSSDPPRVSNLDLIGKSRKADLDDTPGLDKTSFYQRGDISERSRDSPLKEAHPATERQLDFIDFLRVVQWRQIELLPITWQKQLSSIGVGGTARVKQSLVNLDVSLAFKQLHLEKGTTSGRTAALRTSMNEVSVLGHPVIRRHPNIIRLEGVCWDVTGSEIWPVLAFRKADHGNLKEFLFSEAGRSLGFKERIQICSDIGSAVMAMHSFHVIHGDLKPENVLMFEDKTDGFTAKVADFGYSGLSLERSEDSEFHLPISRPWNSPEVNEWASTLPFFAAKKADIYSFGILSIWILFCDYLTTPEDAPKEKDQEKDADRELELLENLKDNDLLFPFAMQCAEKTKDLTEEQIDGLALFFSWTLAEDISARQLPHQDREAAGKEFFAQKEAESPADHKEEIAGAKSAKLTSLGIMYTDIQGHQRPFGYLHYYKSNFDLGYETDHDTFELTSAIPYIAISDYRLWNYLRRCNEARYGDESRDLRSKNDAAFQLALLFKLGLVVPQENSDESDWLPKSGKSRSDLESEVEKIREVKRISFKTLDVPLDLIDYVEQYQASGVLEEAQRVYERTISHLQLLLSDTHILVTKLKSINAKALQGLGNLKGAEQILVHQINANQAAGLSESNEGIAAQGNLVSVYIEASQWRKAEELQLAVLHTSTRLFGEESQQVLTSNANLAVIYWNLHEYDKAEEIQSRHLRTLERSRGRRHQKTLAAMNNLSSTYEYQGRFEDAARLKREALKISSEINGEDHHFTLSLINNLANNYRRRKMVSEAEELDIQVVEIRKRQFGEDHQTTLLAIANLASSYALQGRPKDAEPLERRAVDSFLAQLGAKHSHTLTAQNNLAHTLNDLGKKREAIELMTDVVSGRTEVLGPQHPETKKSSRNLHLWQDQVLT